MRSNIDGYTQKKEGEKVENDDERSGERGEGTVKERGNSDTKSWLSIRGGLLLYESYR